MDLNSIMSIDHPVEVHADGTVTDAPRGTYAPTLTDESLDDCRWTLVTYGYTGQHGYRGPVMHNSETIGGTLAADILAEPGVYVAIAAHWLGDDDDEADTVEGWAVARLDRTDHVWVSESTGGMYVDPEDLATVSAAGRTIICNICDAVYSPERVA